MTRFHLAAAAALSILVLPVAALGGEAPGDDYRSNTKCKTRHTTTRDFAKFKTTLLRREARGDSRRAGAAAFVPVEGAKVITKLIDLSLANGDNVVDRKKKKLTNAKGIAKTKHEFNDFGNYQARVKVKVDGNVVATDQIDFGVRDRESGPCDPPIPGAG